MHCSVQQKSSQAGRHVIPLTFLILSLYINKIDAVDSMTNSTATTPDDTNSFTNDTTTTKNNSTSTTANSAASCTPLNCVAICTPSCDNTEACVLRTMTSCGVCPASACINRTILGLSPLATATSSTVSSQDSGNSNGGLIGGIVGGLLGAGILLGVIVFFYIKKKGRSRGKLPFAFTSGSVNASRINDQMSPPPTPNPAVLAALRQQQQQQFGMAEIPLTSPTSTIPTSSSNSQFNTPLYADTSTMPGTENIPQEFEERIAIQNKRISELLVTNNARRISNATALSRQSGISYTTDDDSDFGDDTSVRQAVVHRPQYQAKLSASSHNSGSSSQAVQVTRAKVQIMRVNSVKQQDGLSRSDSVKTVLTAIEPDEMSQFPSTPNTIENPFKDS